MLDPALNTTVTLIANIALALSLIVAVIFGIAQVRAAARDRRERLTLDMLRNFQTREFAELLHRVVRNEVPKTAKEQRAMSPNEHIAFIQFGQQMESLGLMVAEKLIDIDLVDKTLGSFVTSAWEKYQPVFLELRETTADPFLGEYFQWLAETIERMMRDNPRKPFYETLNTEH
jgi:hypothetical protein